MERSYFGIMSIFWSDQGRIWRGFLRGISNVQGIDSPKRPPRLFPLNIWDCN